MLLCGMCIEEELHLSAAYLQPFLGNFTAMVFAYLKRFIAH